MPSRCDLFLLVCGLLLTLCAFFLQLVAVTTSWWAIFTARTDLGKPKEDGHYGLWSICSTKGPHWNEDCDPLDTFFEVPYYVQISGIFAILHVAIIVIYLIIGGLWATLIFGQRLPSKLKPEILVPLKLATSCLLVTCAILVSILGSVDENGNTEYEIRKGWSFWIQESVIAVVSVLTIICVIENLRYSRGVMKQNTDPEGTRAETYGNPAFDAHSPQLSRRDPPVSTTVACTEASRSPYDAGLIVNGSANRIRMTDKNGGNANKDTFLTYENQFYKEGSPDSRRKI